MRGVYGRDSSANGLDVIRATGFNAVTVQPYRAELNRLAAAGMKGLVWLWGYRRESCSFAHSDEAIRTEVAAIAGHPAILAYQIADEPNYARVSGCPDVASQIRRRSELIHSVDPAATTYVVISTWDGKESMPYRYFAGTTDVMGLNVYPYSREFSRPELIDSAVRAAHAAGVRRYWAILQDFSDGYYVTPNQAQLRDQFRRWGSSRMDGYFVYHWNAGRIEQRPDHLAVYRVAATAPR